MMKLIAIIIIIGGLLGDLAAQEQGPTPGGIEVQVNDAGEPMFLVDIFAIDWRKASKFRWYAVPKEVARQVGSNTVANVKSSPWLWAGTAIAALAATDNLTPVTDLFSGSSGKPANKTVAQETKPTAGLVVNGNGNTVTTPDAGGPIVITGVGNSVTVDPFPNSGQ